MKRFKNILVGVDLAVGSRLVGDELPPPTAEAIERAFWLAKLNSAKLFLLYSLDVSPQTQRLIYENPATECTVVDHAKEVLAGIVERAKHEGIEADSLVIFGKSWVNLIRQVLLENHDLVIIGTRDLGSMERLILGSTGIKLLRKCPCPVWVTQPQSSRQIGKILVAHDLSPVGDLAMQLGCSMAQLHGAELHVVHSVEYSQFDEILPGKVTVDEATQYREKAETHIDAQLNTYAFNHPVQIHITNERPSNAILQYLEKQNIELLVMGTVARTGISGMITGNTAERILPQLPCSVLAVKPDDFVTPISLN